MKTKKSSDKILSPVSIEPGPLIISDFRSNPILSELVRHKLLRRSLNGCSVRVNHLEKTKLKCQFCNSLGNSRISS